MAKLSDKLDNMEARNIRIEQKIDDVQADFKLMKKEIAGLKAENAALRSENRSQEKRIEELEREVRKKNIVVYGITEKEGEQESDMKYCIENIAAKIQVPINVERDVLDIKRIGVKKGDMRPILVEFKSSTKKTDMIKDAKKLKGSNIYLSEDYSREIQQQRKVLKQHLKDARERGQKATLNYNKLKINDKIYTVENLGHTKMPLQNDALNSKTPQEKSRGRTYNDRSPDESEDLIARNTKLTRTSVNTGTISKNWAYM